MLTILVDRLSPGMVIVEGKTTVKVKTVEHNACCKRKIHVNDQYCYDYNAEVQVKGK